MIQTESQRQFYLGVAGIRLWYAREALPGAAPSPEFCFPQPEGPRHAPVSAKTAVSEAPVKAPGMSGQMRERQAAAGRIASLQALMETDKGKPVQTGAGAADTSTVAPASTGQAAPAVAPTPERTREHTGVTALSLAVFAGSRHTLVAQISKEASLKLQETLAANILKSIGEDQVQPAQWVNWPVFNNLLVPGNTPEDLAAVMRQVLHDANDKKVIVLGDLSGGNPDGAWLPEVLGQPPSVECEHSLAELAGDPERKRSLWRQLKPLSPSRGGA